MYVSVKAQKFTGENRNMQRRERKVRNKREIRKQVKVKVKVKLSL
jgi:hypothetical protein